MQFDYLATAQRLRWEELPAAIQAAIEANISQPVTRVEVAGGGFTPGFAAVINDRWFIKAAPARIPWLFDAYRREAEVAAALPEGIPMPRFLGASSVSTSSDSWQLIYFESVVGKIPGNPWTTAELAAVESALVAVDDALSPAPIGLKTTPLCRTVTDDPQLGLVFPQTFPDFLPPLTETSRGQLQSLLQNSETALAGQSLQHNDLRPDNILMTERGALFCDWNFIASGPRWADWVVMLAYARLDGLDVETALALSTLSKDADPDHIDSWLSVLLAYMIHAGSQAEVSNSPALREHQRFSAKMLVDWLIERRELT